MSIFLFVIDGLGMWNTEKKSTFDELRERCNIDNRVLPFLYKVGLKEANNGKGNLLRPKSSMAGSLEGHREMMGYISTNEYDICYSGVPNSIIETLFLRTNIKCVGNIQGRGHDIIYRYANSLNCESIILYSGYDSTISVAFRENDFRMDEIINYSGILMSELHNNNILIRKIIIRQYDKNFANVKSRKEIFHKIQFDERIESLRFPKIIVNNKVQDILELNHAIIKECNRDEDCFKILSKIEEEGFYFINFPDFDLYAHQGNFDMCFQTLKNFDMFIEKFWTQLRRNDYIIVTSDHGVKFDKSDLSNTHVLENVALLCLDRLGSYYFDGIRCGLDYIYRIIQSIQNNSCFYDGYCKIY